MFDFMVKTMLLPLRFYKFVIFNALWRYFFCKAARTSWPELPGVYLVPLHGNIFFDRMQQWWAPLIYLTVRLVPNSISNLHLQDVSTFFSKRSRTYVHSPLLCIGFIYFAVVILCATICYLFWLEIFSVDWQPRLKLYHMGVFLHFNSPLLGIPCFMLYLRNLIPIKFVEHYMDLGYKEHAYLVQWSMLLITKLV